MRRPTRSKAARGASVVGTEITVDVGPPGHGGFCVARHEGRAVFVRHALPGERVLARITEGGTDDRFWRADAVSVLTPSPDRVTPPCPYAAPGECGGCDWQHASLPAQRSLKAVVVRDQLRRLAGLEWDVEVEAVAGDVEGLGWRTRVGYAVDASGRAGLRRHRSHLVVPIQTCLIAHPQVRSIGVEALPWPKARSVHATRSASGERAVVIEGSSGVSDVPEGLADEVAVAARPTERDRPRSLRGSTTLTERAAGRSWRVGSGGFWQVHPGAADTLVAAVLDGLQPEPGESALDLYAGVGLFAGALGEAVGPSGSVLAVEASRLAVEDAAANLADLPQVEAIAGPVDRLLTASDEERVPARVDLIVLDPPRTGAKPPVVAAVSARQPRAVAYVACDPAALARDLAAFAVHEYRLTSLRAFDLFPMTHHVECVAVVEKVDPDVRKRR
jgi:tRNA/tmRNA/rRNA uracil-C5-methylase (TrmA/RlmC/RlmD family)